MITTARALGLLILTATATACVAPAEADDPWRGLSGDGEYEIGDRGQIMVKENGERLIVVRVENGRLYLNDDDLGPYAGKTIQFHRDGTLTVDGEVRGRVGTSED